jgi:hypothetical protein
MKRALLAEYRDPALLLQAVISLREAGYCKLEAYTPYPVRSVEEALGVEPSGLPRVVLVAGLLGAGTAYGLEWLLNAYLYPLNVGGRPPHFPLAYVPITFEMGILCAAFAALGTLFGVCRLLRPWQPIFEVQGFISASRDGFWLSVSCADQHFDEQRTHAELLHSGAVRIEPLEVAP